MTLLTIAPDDGPPFTIDTSFANWSRRRARIEAMLFRVSYWVARDGWADDAACTGMPTRPWYVYDPRAREICEGCPVRLDCLTATLHREVYSDPSTIFGYVAVPARFRRRFIAHVHATIGEPVTVKQRARKAVCGTDSGYYRHRRNAEDPCDPCKAGHAAAEAERVARRATVTVDAALWGQERRYTPVQVQLGLQTLTMPLAAV